MGGLIELANASLILSAVGVTFSVADWIVILVYFTGIVFLGIWFGKFTHTTSDFFFGGQRFPWWLIAVSCIATLVGSYSFVQYSEVGFNFGMASLVPYTNEWFVMPLFLLGWLPIVYFGRLQSVPEYFEKRFDRRTRLTVLVMLLIYLEGYIGINLLTIGRIMDGLFDYGPLLGFASGHGLFGFPVVETAALMAVLSGLYLHSGGQTSVLMTDLFQGALLLVAGLSVVILGIYQLGGWTPFWEGLPDAHKQPFAPVDNAGRLHAIGLFWSDGVTGTFAFFFINQGILMRFLSAKSVQDGRRAMLLTVLVLMPLVAIAVGGAGWVGRSMLSAGVAEVNGVAAGDIFIKVADIVCGTAGLFGLVVAAMIAALMSTLDTLITAVSAIFVIDIWKLVHPDRPDAYYLKTARWVAVGATVLGIALVPLFDSFDSIFRALTHFNSLITPPLVVVLTLGIVWPRFSARAAFTTLSLGFGLLFLSLWVPQLIQPVSHGVPMAYSATIVSPDSETPETVIVYGHTPDEATIAVRTKLDQEKKPDWELDKIKLNPQQSYSYMRSFYGLIVCFSIAIGVTVFAPGKAPQTKGLVLSSIAEAAFRFKGGKPNDKAPYASVAGSFEIMESKDQRINIPVAMMKELHAEPGDLMYVSDSRWWLGGFRSLRMEAEIGEQETIQISTAAIEAGNLLTNRSVRIEKIM
ncbi:hypothetical protein N9Z63_00510 [bacterium]|nr:hypothetical protein [bacterium]MDC0294039.1 hypothetical protein [Mariniblastus sp.]